MPPPEVSPTVSIIVNVYNGERYVAECLDSILALAGDVRPEVVVIDDASTDGTGNILARYRHPQITIVSNEKNIGAAASIDRAFEHVHGEFVARIDYDDRYHQNFLVDSLAALQAYPDAAFVCANVMMIDPEGRQSVVAGPYEYGEDPGCEDRFRSMLTRHFVTAPTILGRTSHWRRAIPIPAAMNFCDWYMNLTMAEAAPVVVLDKVTADYRVHPLGMHATKIADGMGERVTFQVLDRFLDASPRKAELAVHASRIRAAHFADWGDKYFGAGLDDHALRCYKSALASDLALLWRGRFQHRLAGLIAGRDRYDRVKRFARRLLASSR